MSSRAASCSGTDSDALSGENGSLKLNFQLSEHAETSPVLSLHYSILDRSRSRISVDQRTIQPPCLFAAGCYRSSLHSTPFLRSLAASLVCFRSSFWSSFSVSSPALRPSSGYHALHGFEMNRDITVNQHRYSSQVGWLTELGLSFELSKSCKPFRPLTSATWIRKAIPRKLILKRSATLSATFTHPFLDTLSAPRVFQF